MDARYINAFLESTSAVFATMLKVPVNFEKPTLSQGQAAYDVSGVIGLSGDVVGSVVVGFPSETAVRLVAAFTGMTYDVGNADFADAVGELTNMIAGGAKSKFEGMSVSIGCPSVVIAPAHHVRTPSRAACICIPCNTPAGKFYVDVAFQAQARAAQGNGEEARQAVAAPSRAA